EIITKYLEHRSHRLRPTTVRRYTENMALVVRFLRQKRPSGGLPANLLTRPILEDFYVWLMRPVTSHLNRARSKDTARKVVEMVQLMWRWADESDRWPGRVPRPRRIEMPRNAPKPPTAPTWAEMDACIAAVKTPWIAQLLTFLRFTGLRVGETMLLRWSDLDLERRLLTIEPGITKNKRGRIIPVSPHLIEMLSAWPRVGAYVIPSPPGSRDRARQPRPREVALALQRSHGGRPVLPSVCDAGVRITPSARAS
ncbi:MAG: tyrosine-type recombinase/integrase, partial [bacterium]|nr:tyrosine-type recombinase/integrase [bacterium]